MKPKRLPLKPPDSMTFSLVLTPACVVAEVRPTQTSAMPYKVTCACAPVAIEPKTANATSVFFISVSKFGEGMAHFLLNKSAFASYITQVWSPKSPVMNP
jgi:hypothetical protein